MKRKRFTRGPVKKQSAWGDWRPYNAAPLAWNTPTAFVSGTPVIAEIAGQSIPGAAIPTVPFDPGAQLVTGTVTLVEEETFEVQVKGHIDLSITDSVTNYIGRLILQHGLFKSRWLPLGGFLQPSFNVQGVADINWKQRSHQVIDFPSLGSLITAPKRIAVNFGTTLRIGQGLGLLLAIQADWSGPATVTYFSFLEYRIRRNVD